MPGKRLSMRKIKEVLRLKWEAGLSGRVIAERCGIGRTTVREYIQRAVRAGLSWPLPDTLTDTELDGVLFPPASTMPGYERPLPDWQAVHDHLRRKGVTLMVLWEEYAVVHPEGFRYSRYCDLYRAWNKKLPLWMRQDHKAGEKVYVDYAGMTMPVTDPKTREVRQAQIFVAAFGASHYTYAEATWTQTLPDFIASHVRAFAYFGGVSELLVPDNLKQGVTCACRYDPDLNATYERLAEYYGCAILPARVQKPQDKSPVELAVQGIERRVLAKLRNRTFFSLADLNKAIAGLLIEYNERPFQQREGCRRSLFEKLDQPALKPLPAQPYECATWTQARVNLDYHVYVRDDQHYYSVPHKLVGRKLDLRLTVTAVECFEGGTRVASHFRSRKKHGHTTQPEHMPKHHREHAQWTPERIIHWVGKTGPAAAELAAQIIAGRPHPEQGFRACRGLIRLGETYGADRLEAACARALALQSPLYKTVSQILEQNLDRQPLPPPQPETPAIEHDNVRGAQYYNNEPPTQGEHTT